jgi:hypothetical protein
MALLRAFRFRAINNHGAEISEDRYYPYEPPISELAEDITEFVHDESVVYDYENHIKSKWFGGFDDLGWIDEEEKEVRYGD